PTVVYSLSWMAEEHPDDRNRMVIGPTISLQRRFPNQRASSRDFGRAAGRAGVRGRRGLEIWESGPVHQQRWSGAAERESGGHRRRWHVQADRGHPRGRGG